MVKLGARLVGVAVDEDAHDTGKSVLDRQFACTEERNIAEPEGSGRRGWELCRQIVGRGEDDAHEIVMGDTVAGEQLFDEPLRLGDDLSLGVLVARDGTPERP